MEKTKNAQEEILFMGELTIGGRIRPIAVNLNTICEMEDISGTRIQAFTGGAAGTKEIRAFIYAALKEGSRLKNTSGRPNPEYSLEKGGLQLIGSWLSTSNMHDALREVMSILAKYRKGADERMLAPYVPTPPAIMKRAMEMAGLADGQAFADLGCGEGHSLEMAVREFGAAKVVGFELDDDRHMLARARVICLREDVPGFEGSVVKDDLRTADLQQFDVVFIYLLQNSNQAIKEWLAKGLKPGARVVSHDFTMDDWTTIAQWSDPSTEKDEHKHSIYVYEIGKEMAVAA